MTTSHDQYDLKVELDEHLTIHKWGEDFLRVKLPKDKTNHRFYETTAKAATKPERIRRVVNGELTPLQASSEYELMRTLPEDTLKGQITISNYVVSQPSLMVFDSMPAAHYLTVDKNGYALDHDYDNKPYHPSDIPIKHLGKVPVVRIYSPYSISANPYYMDEGLHNIDIQHAGNDVPDIRQKWLAAVREVVESYGLEVKRDVGKLFFKHGDRWVKFESSEDARGVLATYINVDSAYNKAYDFYKPQLPKDVRNSFAYGLKQGNPKITHNIVNEILERFADLMRLPMYDEPYHGDELTRWAQVEKLHAAPDWINDAVRSDANWFYRPSRDGFEHEWDLLAKPESNVFSFELEHSGLQFNYQPALTEAEIASGRHRPPDVVGSYAVKHPTKRDNNYQVGIVTHIFRPIAIDAAGLTRFCDLLIENDVMSVTVPQDFLDTAAYPVVVDPAFGYGTAGASTVAINVGDYVALLNQTGGSGATDSISIYGSATTIGDTIIWCLAIYQYISLGGGALIDYTAQQSTAANINANWYTYNTQLNTVLSNTAYDIGLEFSRASGSSAYDIYTIHYDTGASGIGTSVGTISYSSPPPSTEPTWAAGTDEFSLYVTYGPVVPGIIAQLLITSMGH